MSEETGIQLFTLEWGEVSMDTEIYSGGKVATYYLARVEKQEITLPVSAELVFNCIIKRYYIKYPCLRFQRGLPCHELRLD